MWQPWIGCNYEPRGLLILGESCYDWKTDGQVNQPQPDHPVVMVREAMTIFPLKQRFMDMVSRGLCRKLTPSLAEVIAAWESVAFTNYIPTSVGFGPRKPPSATAWKQAEAEWPLLLAKLKPRNVIILGRRLWNYMPTTQVIVSDYIQGYRLDDGSIAMCRATWHPAGGLSSSVLTREIDAAEQTQEAPSSLN